jgi:hypothetical protein
MAAPQQDADSVHSGGLQSAVAGANSTIPPPPGLENDSCDSVVPGTVRELAWNIENPGTWNGPMDQYVNEGAEAADDSDGFAVAGANGGTDASADRQSDEPETANGITTHQASTVLRHAISAIGQPRSHARTLDPPDDQEVHVAPLKITMTNQAAEIVDSLRHVVRWGHNLPLPLDATATGSSSPLRATEDLAQRLPEGPA